MRALAFAVFILVAAVIGACGGDDTIDDPIIGVDAGVPVPDAAAEVPDAAVGQSCKTSPTFELGSGVREWQPVNDGDLLYLYRGPQGGYMIYLSVRAKGLDRSLIYVDYTEHRQDTGQLIGEGQWKVQLTNDIGSGWWERVGIWGEIEPEFWTKPSIARGHTVTVKAKLTDKNGCTIDKLGWTVNVYPDPPM